MKSAVRIILYQSACHHIHHIFYSHLMLAALPLLKHAYGHLVENKARLGFNHIDKFDFLEAYPLAHAGTFKADTIKNSFAAAGLLPFNPDKVLEQLNIQLRTPTPPDSQSTNSAPETPYNCKQLEKQMAIKTRPFYSGGSGPPAE